MTILEFLLLLTVSGLAGLGGSAVFAGVLGMIGRDEPLPLQATRGRRS